MSSIQEDIVIKEIKEKENKPKMKGGSPGKKGFHPTRRSKAMFTVKDKSRSFAQELKAKSIQVLRKKTYLGKKNKKYFKLLNQLIEEQEKGRLSAIVRASLIDEDTFFALEREGIKKKSYRPRTIIEKLLNQVRLCIGREEFIKLSWKHAKL